MGNLYKGEFPEELTPPVWNNAYKNAVINKVVLRKWLPGGRDNLGVSKVFNSS